MEEKTLFDKTQELLNETDSETGDVIVELWEKIVELEASSKSLKDIVDFHQQNLAKKEKDNQDFKDKVINMLQKPSSQNVDALKKYCVDNNIV